MRAFVKKDGLVINTIMLPDDWTGGEGQWQPESGCTVEKDVGQKVGYADPPVSVEDLKALALEKLMIYVGEKPDAPPEVHAFIKALKTNENPRT
jgi:hypothetical protein